MDVHYASVKHSDVPGLAEHAAMKSLYENAKSLKGANSLVGKATQLVPGEMFTLIGGRSSIIDELTKRGAGKSFEHPSRRQATALAMRARKFTGTNYACLLIGDIIRLPAGAKHAQVDLPITSENLAITARELFGPG